MLGAVNFGHDAMKPVIDAIIDLAESAKEPRALPEEPAEKGDIQAVIDGFDKQFSAAYQIDKTDGRQPPKCARRSRRNSARSMTVFWSATIMRPMSSAARS